MDCLDNERRPHFPQFSYSASGREWPLHYGDIITAGLWGHQCGTKRRTAPDVPQKDLKGCCPSPSPPPPFFFTSAVCFSVYLSETLFRENLLSNPALQTCGDPKLWCDQLLCNVPLMTGASPVACCALTCVGPAKTLRNKSSEVRRQLMQQGDALWRWSVWVILT